MVCLPPVCAGMQSTTVSYSTGYHTFCRCASNSQEVCISKPILSCTNLPFCRFFAGLVLACLHKKQFDADNNLAFSVSLCSIALPLGELDAANGSRRRGRARLSFICSPDMPPGRTGTDRRRGHPGSPSAACPSQSGGAPLHSQDPATQ